MSKTVPFTKKPKANDELADLLISRNLVADRDKTIHLLGARHPKRDKIAGQSIIAYGIVFVEMEHGNEQLAKFYADNGFVLFGSRDDVEDGKPITYDQLFLFLK